MFSWASATLFIALAASPTFAAPSLRSAKGFQPPTTKTGCYVSASVLPELLPANQTALVAPTSAPNFVALGVGVQNYTCSSTGTFTNIGAVAELFDISCIASKPIQTEEFKKWSATSQTVQELIEETGKQPFVLGQHFFIANPTPGGANVPKFDFTSNRFSDNANAFAVMSKVGDILAPTGSNDIDWLELNKTSGALANQIFRVTTVEGTDGAACTSGETASVKYIAKYFFY
ncbi:unnamed protein product [Peniophora sp. CBMAI 1063]|nr:unnamed protein product [Peniophora sp. CBMAI 1063]